jgi:hypothetical protein
MMWIDNLKIFFAFKWLYLYFAIGFLIMPFFLKTQYDNIISCIAFFGCLTLFYQERILEEAKK